LHQYFDATLTEPLPPTKAAAAAGGLFISETSMPLPTNHPVNAVVAYAHSPSVGASAVTAYARAPFRGKVIKVGSALYGAITTADATALR
jgi:hypothetical protein